MTRYKLKQADGYSTIYTIRKKFLGMWWNYGHVCADSYSEAVVIAKSRMYNEKIIYEC
jgi:hypothetical protein